MVYEFPSSKSSGRRQSTLRWLWLLIAFFGAVAGVAWYMVLH